MLQDFAGSLGFRVYRCRVLSFRLQIVQGAVLGVWFKALGLGGFTGLGFRV